MTIWEWLFPWGALRREMEATRSLAAKLRHVEGEAKRRSEQFEAELSRTKRGVGREVKKRTGQLETELLQTKRAGFEDVAKALNVPVEDIIEGGIEPMLHDDPQGVYRALDNAQASEVKFRLVKTVNRELRLVIRNILDSLIECDLTPQAVADLGEAERYAVPKVMLPKRDILHLNHPPKRGSDDGTPTAPQAETKA